MKIKTLLTSILLLLASTQVQATEQLKQATTACASDCAEIVTIKNSRYVIAKDSNGDIFKVIPINLPATSKLVQQTSSKSSLSKGNHRILNTDDTTTETHTVIYRTRTGQLVVVMTVITRDANGDIIDVKVFENVIESPEVPEV